jgi:crotonobetainyl-CoA:carnitine CoA-transferase CaiB-like acyl-CoA transferase
MTRPLEGLRVLDCSLGMAGPRASGMLADLGADVVWVEPPAGDPLRLREPAAVSVFGRGKRSVIVDLTDAEGRNQVLALAARADIFIESWRPGVADELGLGYEQLRVQNGRLLYASVSGYGESGRDADLPAHEAIVQAVLGGMADQVGHRDGPVFVGFPYASIGAAYLAVIGILAALRRRNDDGCGRRICTSLLDGALAYNSMGWGESDHSVAELAASVGTGRGVVGQTATMRLITRSFECGDGEYLGIHTGAVGGFGRAMKVLGLDGRIPASETGMDIGVQLTAEQLSIVANEIPEILKTKPRAEWVRLFLEADVCAVEHLRPTEVYDTPQAIHNDMVVEVDDPVLGRVQQVGVPVKLSASPGGVSGSTPTAGEHTTEVLAGFAGWPEAVQSGPTTPDTRPLLHDLRILDLGAFFAGPYSSRLLADLGADVIKVEPILGDQLRGIERCFFSAQANKRAIAVDLKDPALEKAKHALLGWADVVHHNLRPGAAERLGIDYQSVRKLNRAAVYLHAPGWGSSGPYAFRQSFAPMLSGYVGVTYEVAGQFNPPMPPYANEDPGNGLLGAVAILLALLHRQNTGEGQFLENPQLNATMAHMSHVVRKANGEIVGAGRLDPEQMGVGPFERLYQTADGWVCVVALNQTEQTTLLRTLGAARFDDEYDQAEAIAAAVADTKSAEVVADLVSAGVAAAEPVGRNVHAFMNDPEQRRLNRVAEVAHPVKGNVRELYALVRISDADQVPHRLAPELGANTDDVLSMVGYTAAEIAALRIRKAVR